jgi:hypothetical protein
MKILKNQTSKCLLFEKIKIQINIYLYFDGTSKDNSNKITTCNIYELWNHTCGVGITNFDGIINLN